MGATWYAVLAPKQEERVCCMQFQGIMLGTIMVSIQFYFPGSYKWLQSQKTVWQEAIWGLAEVTCLVHPGVQEIEGRPQSCPWLPHQGKRSGRHWSLLCGISDRAPEEGLKMSQGRFKSGIRERFFLQKMVGHWNQLPRAVLTASAWQSSISVWALLSSTWWDSLSGPVVGWELNFDDPFGCF